LQGFAQGVLALPPPYRGNGPTRSFPASRGHTIGIATSGATGGQFMIVSLITLGWLTDRVNRPMLLAAIQMLRALTFVVLGQLPGTTIAVLFMDVLFFGTGTGTSTDDAPRIPLFALRPI
jgi:hypothetical protein